jgi:hypothetical protein
MPRSGMNMDGGGAQRAVSVESGRSGAQFNAIMPPSATATMTKMTNMPVIIYGWLTLRTDRCGRPDHLINGTAEREYRFIASTRR